MPPPKQIKKGAPPWMATFADLSTLLMTFFVLLLTFASMDVQKFRDMLGSVQQAFGVQTQVKGEYQAVLPEESKPQTRHNYQSDFQPSPPPAASGQGSAEQNSEMAQQINRLVQQAGMGEMVEVNAGSRGVRLRVKGKILFEPGHAEVREQAKRFLDGITQVMQKFDFFLTVEGHTDSTPISTAQFPSNWELSAARAAAVLRYLVERGVPDKRVSAIGYASNYPLADNSSEDGRNTNRRVEFIFTKQAPRLAVD